MTAGTRRATGIVLLFAMLGSVLWLVLSLVPRAGLGLLLHQVRWEAAALLAILLASNMYRLWSRAGRKPPAAKPRPRHLKLVKTDETFH